MGTKVQHKTSLSGYYPMRDFNDSTGNSKWPNSHHENKTLGQYHGIYSAQSEIDGYVGCDKEQLRQTMLKHEMEFRQQLHELHRLYKIQADMMDEMRSKEPQECLKPNGTLQSRFIPFLSSEDKNRWEDCSSPSTDLINHRASSALAADNIQSLLSSMNLKIMEFGCGSVRKGSRSKEFEFLESKCKKLQRRLCDMELQADECINEEVDGRRAPGGSGVESYPPNNWNCEKNSQESLRSGACSIYNGDALSSCVNLKRNLGFTDLNEPVHCEEASGTASVDILGNITSSKEHMQMRDLSASSCSGNLSKETYHSVVLSNLHFKNGKGKKEWPPYNFNPGQSMDIRSSRNGVLHYEYLPAMCESLQIEFQKAGKPDLNRREQSTRKAIFGVEISETNYGAPVIARETCMQQPLISKSNVANSESSSISSWKTNRESWKPNLTSVQGSSSINTFLKFDNRSGRFMHCNVRSFPSLIAEEDSLCDGPILSFGRPNGVSDSNSASGQGPQHSLAINFISSGWLGNAKSVDGANAVLSESYKIEEISDSRQVFLNDHNREENLNGGLSWLRSSSLCNRKYSKERDNSCHANLDFLQNNSMHCSIKADMTNSASQCVIKDSSLITNSHICDADGRRTRGGDGSSNTKILGVPIFEKQIPKDLSSASAMSKSSVSEVEVNGVNSIKPELLADLNQDPVPYDYGEVQPLHSLVAEEVSVDCNATLRDCIDLNVSMTEEEAEPNHISSPHKKKIALDIDLEAPVDPETDIDNSGGEFIESKLQERFDLVKEEPGDGSMRVAADALIAISSSDIHSRDDAIHPNVEASLCDSLQWFAEIISSYEVDLWKDVQSVSAGESSTNGEDSIPNGIDYFEFMTLNLTETKFKVYHYEAEIIKDAKEEVAWPKRSRRGQARRGRQRKDFQRDILPSIVSLSRNDVTEDLKIIEGLIRATGGTWQSSLWQRNSPRGKGRGRKRLSASAASSSPTTTTVTASQPQQEPPKCGKLGLEETRLSGWGKRTRRPPRQRCQIKPCLPSQQVET